jgi:hypothetical protein
MPAAQRRMDRHFLRDACDFVPVWQLVRGTPFENLAKAVQPSPVVLNQVDLSFQFVYGRTVEDVYTLRILNAQFESRYGRSRQVKQKIDLTLRRVPLPPAADVPLTSPLEEDLNE